MREHGVEPGILAVCDPFSDPHNVADYFIDSLGFLEFDILVPDFTNEENPPSIASYYISLFDYIYRTRSSERIKIRLFRSIIRGLLGTWSRSESIGLGPIYTVTLMTDGTLEPLDVLRITGKSNTITAFNVFSHELEDIKKDPLWQEIFYAGAKPCETCRSCEFYYACGGGPVSSRWSKTSRFDNPSVYCSDYKRIIEHIWNQIGKRISLTTLANWNQQVDKS